MPKLTKYCIICKTKFEVWPAFNRKKCCSTKCANISKQGKPLSTEHRKKLSRIAKEKGFGLWMTGKKASKQTKIKQRLSHLGKKYKTMSLQGRKNLSISYKSRIDRGMKPFHKCNGKPIINGYRYIKTHTHPFRAINNYVTEHRLVAEKLIGRFLKKTEIVHHINKNGLDNRPKNIMVFSSISAHRRWHGNIKVNQNEIIFP